MTDSEAQKAVEALRAIRTASDRATLDAIERRAKTGQYYTGIARALDSRRATVGNRRKA
jgi:hypothetical protein